MSKFFYDNRAGSKPKHDGLGENAKRIKLGTANRPLTLSVISEARKVEIEAILKEHKLIAEIEIDSEKAENIIELDGVLNKPKTSVFEKTPNRNEPCSCGSGKKYKKCCG